MISAPAHNVIFVKLWDIAKELSDDEREEFWTNIDTPFGGSAHTLVSAGRLITPLEDMVGTSAVRELTNFCRENINLMVDLET